MKIEKKIKRILKELIKTQKIPCWCFMKDGLELVSLDNATVKILKIIKKEQDKIPDGVYHYIPKEKR